MTDPIRIVVADDHPLFREGVVRSLAEAGGFEVVAEVGSGPEAVAAVGEHMPDLALLDISMPGGGVEAAGEINRCFPAVAIAMLTVSERDADLLASMKAGARGYILKGVGAEELARVLRDVASGQSYVSPDLAARVLSAMRGGGAGRDPLDALTRREEQILSLVARGFSNKEVGAELNLQEKTVKHYMTNILQKLQVRNRVEAAIVARRGKTEAG